MPSTLHNSCEFNNASQNWDKPFSGDGIRIIKSHTFAHQLEKLKTLNHPIVMVYRNDVDCYNWWNDAGGFDITYPNYDWYENDAGMQQRIQEQNQLILDFGQKHMLQWKQHHSHCDIFIGTYKP